MMLIISILNRIYDYFLEMILFPNLLASVQLNFISYKDKFQWKIREKIFVLPVLDITRRC